MPADRRVLLFACFGVPEAPWREALHAALPDLELRFWPVVGAVQEVDYALAWDPPAGFFTAFDNLRAIFSLSAGVERLLADPNLPLVPVVRMVDPGLAAGMVEFVVMQVLHYHRRMPEYRAQQRRALWRPLEAPLAADRQFGIMGLGNSGWPALRRWRGWALRFAVGRAQERSSRAPRCLPGRRASSHSCRRRSSWCACCR